MKRRPTRNIHVALAAILWIAVIGRFTVTEARDQKNQQSLNGRIVAVGIPGASAISAVGTFLPGGPIHDNPAFAAYTQPGAVLDPVRILVGSTSNFGAP